MKAIKKAQKGAIVKDKTAVAKPKRKPDIVATKPKYTFIQSSKKDQAPTKQDSINYKQGFNKGKQDKKPLFWASDMNTYMGSIEGAKDTRKSTKLKTGGSVKAKDGKWIQKATASIKRRGTEGKCTPITKKGCTGKAKALAKTFKAMAKARKK